MRLPLRSSGFLAIASTHVLAKKCLMARRLVERGVHHGETDVVGQKTAVNRVSVNDLHATLLQLLGLDHQRVTFRYNARDFRLTDVSGYAVRKIIA